MKLQAKKCRWDATILNMMINSKVLNLLDNYGEIDMVSLKALQDYYRSFTPPSNLSKV